MREFTANDLDGELAGAGVPILVDFWAEWCAPCRNFRTVLEELETELGGRIVVGGLDVGVHPEVAERYQVSSVPTAILFVDGEPVRRIAGPRPKRHLLRDVEVHL